jgi:2,4-dienoyl-CoA reductase-like NADH-dependent reductase (Old Yellow Enzyme family)/thioredoxin reductase
MENATHIFRPIKVGALTAKNRIEAAPVSVSDLTREGYLTDAHAALYGMKAKGGAGIVTIGEGYVSRSTGRAHALVIPLYDEFVLPGLIQTTDAIKAHGAIASAELLHCGVRSHPQFCQDGRVYGPSEGMNVYGARIIEMDEDMISQTVESYGDSAEMAQLGGADMVMIHGGHGWLLSNFLSPIHNQRTDRFGGSIENRARISLMVVENIRKKCGPKFPIEFRMSGSEFIEGGFTLEDTVEFAKLLDGKVDIIHVSATSFHDPDAGLRMFPGVFLPHGCNVFLAEAIKKAVKTPVATVGGINSAEDIEDILAAGKADIVALGRALSADPFLPEKIRSGNPQQIRPCIRCNNCISSIFVPYIKYATRVSRCTVNPDFGRELDQLHRRDPLQQKKVMIIGGGPGGMQAAITAADRGHDVLLFEKTDALGGELIYATAPDFKADLKKYTEYLIQTVQNSTVKVVFNTEVTVDFVKQINPGVLIIAVGAKPIKPRIPGIDNKKVLMAGEMARYHPAVGQQVVIVGGGLAGCEEGLYLARQGKDVTVLEMKDRLAMEGTYLYWRALMLELEKEKRVKTVTHTICREINDEGVVAETVDGNKIEFKADTIIIAAGFEARTELVDSLRECDCKYTVIGDCVKPATVLESVHGGHFAALNI